MTTLGHPDRPVPPPRVQLLRDEQRMARSPAAASNGAPLVAPIRSTGFAAFRLLGPQEEVGASQPQSSLANRSAGQAVIAETLRIQHQEPSRSWWQRLVGTSPLSDRSYPWFKGALGEISVGQILARLGPEWTVLHAVPVGAGASDIDHVVIGPAGVFTLNTKNHAGRDVWVGERAVLIDGHKQHYLPHARHEAARAAKRLSAAVGEPVSVTPVLVLIEPKTLTIKQRPDDVTVVTDRELLRRLQRRRPVLTPEQVTRITAAAVVPSTWHDNPASPEDPVELRKRFAELRASVRSARLRQGLWRLGGPVAALVLFFGAEPGRSVLSAF
ncbi:nuclease-related domain-containing protein [Kocuria sabuli]|uniref:nuclease-related domain-containing protein n=1 Tax=Kocuria sabuli TaxID=3071448 RepID=UPI0034D472A0